MQTNGAMNTQTSAPLIDGTDNGHIRLSLSQVRREGKERGNSARNYLLYLACLHKLAASDAFQLQLLMLLLLLLLPQDVAAAAAEEIPRKNDAYQT